MARNGSGTYTVPTTLTANTRALAGDVNDNFTDIATALTGSLALDGQSTMTGQFKAADGSITAPGIGFGSDSNTGFYRSASGVIRASLDGTNTLTLSATGATITGTVSVSGAITATGGITGGGIVPSGGIIMWSGSVATIPTGWLLCDGTNSTPDLRDKFIIGAKQDDSGTAKTNVTGALTQTGGSKDAVNVSHTHTATVTDPGHDHDVNYQSTNLGAGGGTRSYWTRDGAGDSMTNRTAVNAAATATTGITVENSTEGSSGTNANLPPYYALAFIMKS